MSHLGTTMGRITGSGSLHKNDWLNAGIAAAATIATAGAAGLLGAGGAAAGAGAAGAGAAGAEGAGAGLAGLGLADTFAPGEGALSGLGAGLGGGAELAPSLGLDLGAAGELGTGATTAAGSPDLIAGSPIAAGGPGDTSPTLSGLFGQAKTAAQPYLKTAKGLLAGANVASKLQQPPPVSPMHIGSGFQPNNGFQLPGLSMPSANYGLNPLAGIGTTGGVNYNDPQVQALLAQLARGGGGYG